MVGFTFAPRDWANCDGQNLQISQNAALYALLGTAFGGDGRVTVGLPDFRGRVPIGVGYYTSNSGTLVYTSGNKGGTETVTLLPSELPLHFHYFYGQPDGTNAQAFPQTNEFFSSENPAGQATPAYSATSASNIAMNSGCIGNTGGGQSHNNMQPYNVIRYIIALEGLFPPRN